MQAYDDALRLAPEFSMAQRRRAEALVKQHLYAEAVAAYDRYLAKQKLDPDAYQGRGRARMKLQHEHNLDAVLDFTQVLFLAEKPSAEMYVDRAWAYFFCDRWELAQLDFEAALPLTEKKDEAYVGRGLCQVMRGRYVEAVRDADRARPETPEMAHNRACIYAQAVERVGNDKAATDRQALAADYGRRLCGRCDRPWTCCVPPSASPSGRPPSFAISPCSPSGTIPSSSRCSSRWQRKRVGPRGELASR